MQTKKKEEQESTRGVGEEEGVIILCKVHANTHHTRAHNKELERRIVVAWLCEPFLKENFFGENVLGRKKERQEED